MCLDVSIRQLRGLNMRVFIFLHYFNRINEIRKSFFFQTIQFENAEVKEKREFIK